MTGPPGGGKTMAAKAFASILPPLTMNESIEVRLIHSLAYVTDPSFWQTIRPFRSPHHTISFAGLVGGGSNPRPGEISLAHRGVLFLDELPEFSRTSLEALRQPLEDRQVTIARAHGHVAFPSDVICIAAMNPCPCGYFGHPNKPCKDSPLQIERYQKRISGPFLDRMDLHIYVSIPTAQEKEIPAETSTKVRERILQARERQYERLGRGSVNAQMSSSQLNQIELSNACKKLMEIAIKEHELSMRAQTKILKVARTIGDLEGVSSITEDHIFEALQFKYSQKT